MTLATFDISTYCENGVEMVPDTDHGPGSVRYEILDFLSRLLPEH